MKIIRMILKSGIEEEEEEEEEEEDWNDRGKDE